MIYFGYFIILFLFVRLLVAITNFLSFRYLPNIPRKLDAIKVSILIPARNEEGNIGKLLTQITSFMYAPLEILVYNDNSTDRTSEIVNSFASNDERVILIEGEELPIGWLGKNRACHNLAKEANGELLLFLDADVEVQDGLIERAISHLQKYDLHLLSIFPKQIFKSLGERISVPLMNWILLSLLPLILIRRLKNAAFSAANGQFMLFRADTYTRIWPHKIFRLHQVEDIATIKYFKEQGLKSDTLLGNKYIACNMYSGLVEAIEGFTKNIFQFFGKSVFLTVIVGVITSIAPFIIFFYFGSLYGSIYLIGIILVRVFVSLASKQSVLKNIIFMIPQHIVFLIIIAKGIINHKRKELIWKGRNILQD